MLRDGHRRNQPGCWRQVSLLRAVPRDLNSRFGMQCERAVVVIVNDIVFHHDLDRHLTDCRITETFRAESTRCQPGGVGIRRLAMRVTCSPW